MKKNQHSHLRQAEQAQEQGGAGAQKTLRVAVLNRFFSVSAGGAESYSANLCAALAAIKNAAGPLGEPASAAFEIHVFAQKLPPQAEQHPALVFHQLPGTWLLGRSGWLNQLAFAWTSWRATAAENFDVVHSHENTWHGDVQTVHVKPFRYNEFFGDVGGLGVALRGLRLHLRCLGFVFSPRKLAYLLLESLRLKKSPQKKIVAVSPLLQRQICTAYPAYSVLSSCDVAVIPPASAQVGAQQSLLESGFEHQQARAALFTLLQNLSLHSQIPKIVDKKLLLFVGHDWERKGLPALLAALRACLASASSPNPNADSNRAERAERAEMGEKFCLLVVGRGLHEKQRQRLQAQVEALGLTQAVVFFGRISDLSVLYRAADLLVHPTLEDSYAMVVLEAMAVGLPVLVSGEKHCGIAAWLRDGENACLLEDPQNAGEIAEKITRLFTNVADAPSAPSASNAFNAINNPLREKIARGGMAFAQQQTWEECARRYAALYRARAQQ